MKLRQSAAYRRLQGSLLLVGEDLVQDVAAAGTTCFRSVAALAGQPFPPGMEADTFLSLSEPAMRKLTGLDTVPRSVLAAEVEAPRLGLRPRLPPAGFRLLALDAVQDPGNLGTLLRTALALGWDGALLLPGCADPFSDKVLRSSRAAAFRLPVVALSSVDDWQELTAQHSLEPLAGVVPLANAAAPAWMIDASSTASASRSSEPVTRQRVGVSREPATAAATSYTANLGQVRHSAQARRVCLVLGSEGRGVSPELAALCQPVTVPQPGDMESLVSRGGHENSDMLTAGLVLQRSWLAVGCKWASGVAKALVMNACLPPSSECCCVRRNPHVCAWTRGFRPACAAASLTQKRQQL